MDHLRGDPSAVDLLTLLIGTGGAVAASEVVRFELLAGVRPDEVAATEQFFQAIDWVPVNEDVTRLAAELARMHRRSHGGIDIADYLIAATAILLGGELLTTNVRHFPMLKGLKTPY